MAGSDEIDAAIWKVLRASYLRLLCYGSSRPVGAMTDAEQNAALDAHFAALDIDMAAIRAVLDHHVSSTFGAMRSRLHAAPGLDHAMVDEAVSFALSAGEVQE